MKTRDRVSSIMIILIITKLLGFIKIRIIAELFGVSRELDIFWAAFTIPDTLFNVLVAGAINAAIIPVFSDVLHGDGEKALKRVFKSMNIVFAGLFALFSIIFFIFAPQVGQFLLNSEVLHGALQSSATITTENLDLFVNLMRIMLLSPMFLGVSSILTAYLQVRKRFFSTSLAPLMYNIGMVVVSLALVNWFGFGVEGVAWAVVAGSALHLFVQLPLALKYYRETKDDKKVSLKDDDVISIFKLGLPRILGLLGEHINVFVNTVISFTLSAGALSAYKFAYSLHLFPVHIFGSAISQVALPNLAEYYTKGMMKEFKETFNKAIHQSMFLILPVASSFLTLKVPIVRILLNFSEWEATTVTATSLALLSVAVVGQAMLLIILRAFYAIKETKLLLVATFVTMVVNIAGSYLFTNFFSHYYDWRPIIDQIISQIASMNGDGLIGVVGSFAGDTWRWMTTRGTSTASVYGLALSTSLSFVVEVILGIYLLNLRVKVVSKKETIYPLIPMVINSFITSFAMYIMFKLADGFFDTSKTLNVLILTIVVFLYGGLIYSFGSKVLKIKEFDYVYGEAKKLLSTLIGRVGRVRKHVKTK